MVQMPLGAPVLGFLPLPQLLSLTLPLALPLPPPSFLKHLRPTRVLIYLTSEYKSLGVGGEATPEAVSVTN